MSSYYLYKHCIPVKGHSRSIIYDLWRCVFYYIPNSLYDILVENEELNMERLMSVYGECNNSIIKEYWCFLQDKDLIHNKKGYFLPLPSEYETPCLLDNAVIDIEKKEHDYYRIKEEFERVGVSSILLRFWHNFHFGLFYNIIKLMSKGSHNDLHILIPYDLSEKIGDIKQFVLASPLLSYICIYSAPYDRISYCNDVVVEYIVKDFVDENSCGNVSLRKFTVNSALFFESQKFNNCLYKKVSIDKNGFVKNCPSMSKTYGKIDNVCLLDVLKNKEFTSLWNINKGMISECNVCEYRYMCIDCRIYRENENIYSKPLKCKYNVIQCKWSK